MVFVFVCVAPWAVDAQTEQAGVLSGLCAAVADTAGKLGVASVTLYVCNPDAPSAAHHVFTLAPGSGAVIEHVRDGATAPALPIGDGPGAATRVSPRLGAALSAALDQATGPSGRAAAPLVLPAEEGGGHEGGDGDATLVLLPLLDEERRVLGVVVVQGAGAGPASTPSPAVVQQARCVAQLAACGVRSWVEAVQGRGGDNEDEEAAAGIASPQQLRMGLALSFSGWAASDAGAGAATAS